jgi:hypothetical protein
MVRERWSNKIEDGKWKIENGGDGKREGRFGSCGTGL